MMQLERPMAVEEDKVLVIAVSIEAAGNHQVLIFAELTGKAGNHIQSQLVQPASSD